MKIVDLRAAGRARTRDQLLKHKVVQTYGYVY
jgi:hypothetical protein